MFQQNIYLVGITSLEVSVEGHYAVTGSVDQTIAVWDLKNQKLIHRYKEVHKGIERNVARWL